MKRELIENQIAMFKGMQLIRTSLAADMRMFDFCSPGKEKSSEKPLLLHVQCPWRIEKDDRIITGRYDYWEPLKEIHGEEYEAWEPDKDDNLQEHIMESFMKDRLYVRDVHYTGCGGFALEFTNGTKLCLFPHGTRAEDWRLFRKGQSPHFVVAGGEIEGRNKGKALTN